MIIKSFEIFKFKIPLKFPLKIANIKLTFREGLILKITDENENTGIGEISPLPGLHHENLIDAKFQLDNFLKNLINKNFSINFVQPSHMLNIDLALIQLYPSVHFGVESALLSLQSRSQNIPYFQLFNKYKKKSVKINALLFGTNTQIIEKNSLVTLNNELNKLKLA